MAEFKKGTSMNGVNLIATIRPNRYVHAKDKDGNATDKINAQYVDIAVDNSTLTADDIAAGKGQSAPSLYSRNTGKVSEKTGKPIYDHGICLSMDQIDVIKKAGGENTLTKEDGTAYVPFKADLMFLKGTVKDNDGNAIKKNVGYLPNTKTVEASDFGQLTQERLDAHFSNTAAISAKSKEAAAAEKAAPEAEAEASEKTTKKTTKSRKSKFKAVDNEEIAAVTPEKNGPEMPF